MQVSPFKESTELIAKKQGEVYFEIINILFKLQLFVDKINALQRNLNEKLHKYLNITRRGYILLTNYWQNARFWNYNS